MKISRQVAWILTASVLVLGDAEEVTLPLSAANVHWGFFSKTLEPVLTVASGTEVTVEMVRSFGIPCPLVSCHHSH